MIAKGEECGGMSEKGKNTVQICPKSDSSHDKNGIHQKKKGLPFYLPGQL